MCVPGGPLWGQPRQLKSVFEPILWVGFAEPEGLKPGLGSAPDVSRAGPGEGRKEGPQAVRLW